MKIRVEPDAFTPVTKSFIGVKRGELFTTSVYWNPSKPLVNDRVWMKCEHWKDGEDKTTGGHGIRAVSLDGIVTDFMDDAKCIMVDAELVITKLLYS